MLGRKLATRLDGSAELELVDIAGAPVAADISEPGVADRLVASRPDTIFHLAAVLSGESEADFDKGYRVNLGGTRALLEAVRAVGDGCAQPRPRPQRGAAPRSARRPCRQRPAW